MDDGGERLFGYRPALTAAACRHAAAPAPCERCGGRPAAA
ncbi:hypothetical protein MYA_2159 [Burkholderia sp. KJ006]|nr:hypothetical protein MYA_2159 [Burkholderia sp. KJ006]